MEFRVSIRCVLLVKTFVVLLALKRAVCLLPAVQSRMFNLQDFYFGVQCREGALKRTVLSQIREVEQQDLQFRTCKIVVSLCRGILFFHGLILQGSTQMVVWMQAAGFRSFSAAFWTVREK